MQIYEVKNDTAEILYAPSENNLFLSDFLFAEDDIMTVVSQVTDIATTERDDINVASVRFCFSVDKDNRLFPYDGHVPSKDSDVGTLDAKEIIGLFRPKNKELIWGGYIRNKNLKVSTDLKYLSAKTCIVCDKIDQSSLLVNNLIYSLNAGKVKTIVLDFDGKYKAIKDTPQYTFGIDYKIPLNTIALDYLFEKELEDCSLECKAIIQNIILEVRQYVETLSEGFISFDLFANIINSECKKSANPGLMIFANKLMQYKQKNIFADEKEQFAVFDELPSSCILDVSFCDSKFHNLILDSITNSLKRKFYVIADVGESNLTNDTLKRIYERQNIRLIPICSYEDKFLPKIKSYCKNFVLFAPSVKNPDDNSCSGFLNKISQENFILYGEGTFFIPIITVLSDVRSVFELSETDDNQFRDKITSDDLDDLDALDSFNDEEKSDSENFAENNTEEETIDVPQEEVHSEEVPESSRIRQGMPVRQRSVPDRKLPDESRETIPERKPISSPEKVEYSNESVVPVQSAQRTAPGRKHPAVVRAEKRNTEQPKPKPNPDELPVYSPKSPTRKVTESFEEGCIITHPKYGKGIVEKTIKYGSKTLCSIQFDNIGRRLLDPAVTELTKL